ncbi:G-protein coupled receptor 4-like [Sphaeramia orbicularis]|uniref:G-protein coupled receptor 4-like n=1 Tax=Sphaeramia orbicularis TaxID=375764 RepID=UPI00117D2A70|nr:G-protein coupled receptor 4-like [Sphaeramia orbicularis]
MDASLQNTSISNLCTVNSSLVSPLEYSMYPAAYSLFFIVGFPANCLSLYVAWMLMRNGSNMAVYLVSLSISDLLYIVSLPVWIELSLRRPVGCGLCSVTAVVMNNSFYVGSGLLCCISVDRYLAVVYPLHFHWVREVRTAAVVCVAVWTLEIVIHIILLSHTGALQAFSSSTLCMEKIPMSHETAHLALTRVILGFFVPFVIMSFCFQQIMYSLKRSTSIVAEERRKVGRLLLLLLLAYVVAFVPYQTVMLLRAVLEPRTDTSAFQLKAAYLVTVATTTLNSVLDPIIYCLISESAQGEIKKLIEKGRQVCKWRRKSEVSNQIQSVSQQL